MFHRNLNSISYFDSNSNPMQPGSETFNSSFLDGETGDLFSFQNISISYCSDPVGNPIANAAWGFNFRILTGFATGENQLLNTTAELATWLVRDSDVLANTPIIDPLVVANTLNIFAMLFFGKAGALATRKQYISQN
jgi:hypothetical protein